MNAMLALRGNSYDARTTPFAFVGQWFSRLSVGTRSLWPGTYMSSSLIRRCQARVLLVPSPCRSQIAGPMCRNGSREAHMLYALASRAVQRIPIHASGALATR